MLFTTTLLTAASDGAFKQSLNERLRARAVDCARRSVLLHIEHHGAQKIRGHGAIFVRCSGTTGVEVKLQH